MHADFRLLLDHAPLMAWLSGTDNRCIYFNPAWLEFTGRPLARELGEGWLEGVHPEDRERARAEDQRGFENREEFRLEYRLRRHDGVYRWMMDQCTPRYDARGRFAGYLGSCTDITELREAAADARRWQRRYEAALSSSGWIAYEVMHGRMQWSEGIEQLIGYPAQWLKDAAGWWNHVHPDDRTRVENQFERSGPEAQSTATIYRVRHREGHYVWIEDRAYSAGEGPDGERVIGFVSDVTERLRNEEMLRRSEERFRLATDVVNGIVYSHDLDTDTVECSGQLLQELGFGPGGVPLTRAAWLERVHPDDRERLRDVMARGRNSVAPVDAQYRLTTRAGSVVHVLGRMKFIRDEQGVPHRLIGFLVDVSQIHQAELALRRSEERFRLAAEAVDGIVYEYDMNSGVINRSGRLLHRLGYGDSLSSDRASWLDLLHPDDRTRAQEQVRQALVSDSNAAEAEYRLRDARGAYHHVLDRVLIVRSVTGAPERMIGCALDISRQKTAEAALRRSEERFRLAAEAVDGIVYEIDIRSGQVARSGRLLHRLGYGDSLANDIGAWVDLLHPDDRARALGRHAALANEEGRDTAQTEYRLRDAFGEYHQVLDRVLIMRNAAGEPERMVGCTLDISALKEAERQILRLNAELEQRVEERTAALQAANQELEAFTYSVSHDLRAPLRHVAGFTDLLRSRLTEVDPQSQRYLETIVGATARMAEMIDKLLALSRVGRGEMRPVEVDLGDLVAEVRDELAGAADGRNVDWKIGALPVVHADRALLRGAVQNLLANALKFTTGRDPAVIEVCASPDTGAREHEIVVRDNGAGFDMKYVGKLFGVFQRLHAPGEFEGTGIGLASVRRIINRHGGRVWAQGTPGAGAEFHFTLPALEPPAQQAQQ